MMDDGKTQSNIKNDGLDRSSHLDRYLDLSGALSWYEARKRLMTVLENYMTEPFHPTEKNHNMDNPYGRSMDNTDFKMKAKKLCIWGLQSDLDIILGSVLLSFVLLILSAQASDLSAERIVASILLVLTSLTSVCINFRWKNISSRDMESKKRRIIANFLLEMRNTVKNDRLETNRQSSDGYHDKSTAKITLNGTSLSDVYTVYRLPSMTKIQTNDKNNAMNEDNKGGEWHRVPSLLLVEGDYIALQIGDIAPASCEAIHDTKNNRQMRRFSESSAPAKRKSKRLIIQAHEKVPSTLHLNAKGGFANLPPGRSRLPNKSKVLMQATGNIQVFQLKGTPINEFLHTAPSPQKKTQIGRQLTSVRMALFCFSTLMFFFSACILLIREGSKLLKNHQLLSIIILAALGVLPVTTPICTLLIEVFGTSKILMTVHHHAVRVKKNTTNNGDTTLSISNDNYMQESFLFCKYVLSTILSRLGFHTWKRNISRGKALVETPPASLHIFERLGVVNALALVDDELACEPFSTPERLLLPTGAGAFKLLDLYPYYGDDDYSTDQELVGENEFDSGTNTRTNFLFHRRKRRRRRKRTFSSLEDSSLTTNDQNRWKGPGSNSNSDDSDSEFSHSHQSISSRRVSMFKRGHDFITENWKKNTFKKKDNIGEYSNLCEVTKVQFEDPSWWQHLPSLKCIGLACLLMENNLEDGVNEFYHSSSNKMKHAENESDSTVSEISQKNAIKQNVGNNLQTVSNTENVRVRSAVDIAELHLVHHICQINKRNYFRLLSECIGFSTQPNSMGPRGDISSFMERKRIHVIDANLSSTRALLDRHAIGLEESRRRGILQPDSTSVLIEDSRSKSLQLLSMGDARVVTQLCSDQWQGDTLTITPLRAEDRRMILDTAKNWSLSDLEVTVFAYVPVPVPPDKRSLIGTGLNIGYSQKSMPNLNLSTQSQTVVRTSFNEYLSCLISSSKFIS